MQQNEQLPATAPATLMDRLGPVAIGDRGIVLKTIEDVFRIAKAVSMSQLCPPGWNENDCFLVLLNALEIGLPPLQALSGSYIVNNRVSLYGETPKALVEASGLMVEYKQEEIGTYPQDDYGWKVTSQRKGREPVVTTYTIADAKTAELWGKTLERTKEGRKYEIKTPWVTAPKRMLLFRARGFNLKDNFADVFKGTAIRELEDEPGLDHAKPAAARVVEPHFEEAEPITETPIPEPPAKRGPGRPHKAVVEAPPEPTPSPTGPPKDPTEPPQTPVESPESSKESPASAPPDKTPITAAAEPPESATKPAAPNASQTKQGSLFPGDSESVESTIRRRLAEKGHSWEAFKDLLQDYGFMGDRKDLELALHDWARVEANLTERARGAR